PKAKKFTRLSLPKSSNIFSPADRLCGSTRVVRAGSRRRCCGAGHRRNKASRRGVKQEGFSQLAEVIGMSELDKSRAVDLLNRILEAELAGVVRYTHYS